MNPETLLLKYRELQKELADWFYEYYYEEKPEWREDYYWIAGGTVLGIGDMFVWLEEITEIIWCNIPLQSFHDWYWYCLEDEKNRINLVSYHRIRREGTHEYFLKFQEEQRILRETPEWKAEHKANLKAIYDKGIKDIEKYINK